MLAAAVMWHIRLATSEPALRMHTVSGIAADCTRPVRPEAAHTGHSRSAAVEVGEGAAGHIGRGCKGRTLLQARVDGCSAIPR